jgi:hypothetical protein
VHKGLVPNGKDKEIIIIPDKKPKLRADTIKLLKVGDDKLIKPERVKVPAPDVHPKSMKNSLLIPVREQQLSI